jgi:hypothetical protein
VLFQGFPHWAPVLRRRLHDDFLDVMLDEPVREATQIARRRADLLVLEVEFVVDLDVGHHDAQLFVQSRTLRIKQLLGLNGSTGLIRSRRSPALFCRTDFHRVSRAGGPS